MSNQADVIVIGGGPAGENAAARAVEYGLSAVLIESDRYGGECSYWACMPSKALIRPATALQAARNVAGAKQAVVGEVDVSAVLARRDAFAAHWDDVGQAKWASGAGIDLVRGRGRLDGDRSVAVDSTSGTKWWTAAHAVVIATGSRPRLPPIPGLDDARFWGTREATSASAVPRRLAVIGGGVAGTELAQAFARLGADVTLLARSGLLAGVPRPAAGLVEDALVRGGVDVRTSTAPARVDRGADGAVRIELNGDTEAVVADEVLVATGRRPAVDELGLETVGVDTHEWKVDVDGLVGGQAGEWLYAVSDVAGTAPLTHQGKYEARVVADAIACRAEGEVPERRPWSKSARTASFDAVPQVVFTDPEVAVVGLSEEKAAERGLRTRTVTHDLGVAGAALHADGYTGWAQLIVDEDRRVVVGAAFAGPDVSELLHAATIAIVGEVELDRLWHAVPAYPTISEVWLRLLESYGM